jgi:hypothetical protein
MLIKPDQWLRRPTTLCLTRALFSALETGGLTSGGLKQRKPGFAKWIHTTPFENSFIDNSHLEETREGALHLHNSNDETQQFHDGMRLQQAIVQLFPERMKEPDAVRTESIEPSLALPDPLENPSAWIEALEQQGKLHGIEGVVRVWVARKRENYRLPVEGRDANTLWTALFRAAIVRSATEHHRILFKSVYEHALEVNHDNKSSWSGLYACVVGLWLRLDPTHARTAHNELISAFDCTHVDLRDLAMDCAYSQDPISAIRAFRHIYKTFRQQNLYDAFVVPMLSDNHSVRDRFEWHNFFVSRGDLPSSKVFALPSVQEMFAEKDKFLALQSHASESVAAQSAAAKLRVADFSPLTRASMSALAGDVHGIKPKQVSDSFVAKLLATWAFPLDFLVNGLGFLGVESLGPQALRQLAVRCGSCAVFEEKIGELKEQGIEPKASNYSRVMQQVVREGLETIFQTLLLSDQHPDIFEDVKVQTALLHAFLEKDDRQNAHLTLIVLSLLDDRGNANAWNAVLKHNIKKRDVPSIESMTRRMRSLQIPVDLENLKIFRARIVGFRSPGKKPMHVSRSRSRIRPLNYLASMAMFSLQNGINVGPGFWVELLKRYGVAGDLKNVKRLTMWLLSKYRVGQGSEWAGRCCLNISEVLNDCRRIFSGNMLGALVVWGFRAPSPRLQRSPSPFGPPSIDNSDGSLQVEPWARGLMLLRQIGLHPSLPTLAPARKAFRQRMWTLFGPAYSTRAINPDTVRRYNLSLSHCVLHANQIFAGKLFPGIESFLLEPEAANPTAVMTLLFGKITSSGGREWIIPAPLGRLRYELRKGRRKLKPGHHTPKHYYKSKYLTTHL